MIRKKINIPLIFILLIAIVFHVLPTHAQVTIGSGNSPDKGALLDLKEEDDGSSTKGLLLPRVALVNVNSPSPLEEHVAGMYVYNTTNSAEMEPGNYFNDGLKWNRVKNLDSEPWGDSETLTGATSVDDKIYHQGMVGIGVVQNDPSAQLEVASNSMGVLIPRLAKSERDAIDDPANGLMIFNTTSTCLNYYNKPILKWLSMCGTYDPANFELFTCDSPVGPQGIYTEGAALNTTNNYLLVVNVSDAGSYEIVATTTNGYTFSKSGLFTSTGTHQVELNGQGAPITDGINAISITFNGIAVTPSCQLPTITVVPASTRLTFDCASVQVFGEYTTNVSLNSSNYIEVGVNVTAGGELVVETAFDNGIKFSSGPITVTTATTTIKLYGQGTPTRLGVFTGNTFTIDGNTCTPSVTVITSLGGFDFPADRCQDILNENEFAADGYYWVKNASGQKIKTYCDMEPDGAWTLVKSLSERQILVVEKKQSESIATQGPRNIVTTKEGKFNEYAFSLPAATVNSIGSSTGSTKKFKFTIKEKGHTTATSATYQEIESSTTSPNNDVWTQDNNWTVTIYSGNPATGNFTGNGTNNISEGKLFGKPWGKPRTPSTAYFFDNIGFAITPPGMYSSANFFTGFYSGRGYVAANNASNEVTYTYHDRTEASENGKTFTFRKYDINDLFGLYMNLEPQLNHHIGTCSNSTDDFGGASFCNQGWANWRAHKFNQRPDSSYEGRIVQYWVQ